jgi:hypothetical protein
MIIWAFHVALTLNYKHMKLLTALLVSLFSVAAAAQKQDMKPFTAIDVFGGFQIELIASDREAIEMEAFNIDQEDLQVEVHRGVLELKIKNRHYLTDWDSDKFRKSPRIKTKIYYKELDRIEASAGAIVRSAETIRNKKIEIISTMGAEVTLITVAEVMYVKATMGGVAYLSGRTEFLEAKAGMGGELKASRLESKSAFVRASMGGSADVFASEEIDVDASMGADVRYSGNPTVRHTSRKMGAVVGKH